MSSSAISSPVRSRETGSPGFKSQRKMSAGTIIKKIQTLEEALESLRQQLVFTRSEQDSVPVPQKEVKQNKKQKEPKEKMPAPKAPAATKQKKTQNAVDEEKDKIPMPWTGGVDFTTCVGLKAQYGLFIQCGKACDMSSASFQIDNHECRFCNDCSKKCDENGKHSVGTMEERIEAGVGKYVNAKTGKKESMYIEVLEKMGITKEQALDSAARRGFQIPDWMLEKAEKKRGRPATVSTATANKVTANNVETETEIKTKEKKPRQPRAKKTVTKASVSTIDTPQKKDSVQSSVCIDLNQNDDDDDGDITPVVATENVTISAAAAAAAATPIHPPQEKEKKKRGRPTKSNSQNNIGESEMQQLIAQATTEKKKRLSLDPADICTSTSSHEEEANGDNIETRLVFESETSIKSVEEEYMIFEMFDKLLEEDEKQQEQQQEVIPTHVVDQIVVVTNEKKEKTKKVKTDNKVEKVEKVEKKKKDNKVSKKEAAAAAAAKKKAEEEAAAAAAAAAAVAAANKKKAEEEADEETDDEEDDDEELECEEYEYDGETYGLAPNGDIYSQDGDLVGKLTNGVPKMFS